MAGNGTSRSLPISFSASRQDISLKAEVKQKWLDNASLGGVVSALTLGPYLNADGGFPIAVASVGSAGFTCMTAVNA
jgi:hypothetical protein